MTYDEMIAVIQAAKEGKAIEFGHLDGTNEWFQATNPKFDFQRFNYRIKPEPREVVGWIHVDVFNGDNCTFFRRDENPHTAGVEREFRIKCKLTEIIE